MKSYKKLVLSVPVLLLTACAGGPPDTSTAVLDCTYPDAIDIVAPGWICDEPVEGVELSAVGYFNKSSAGVSFMKQMAVADARVQLAQVYKVHVNNMITQYAQTTGSADSETVDLVNASVSKLITSETLVGSRLFKSKVSPTGGLYVIVGLDGAEVQKSTEGSIRSSMANDNALWQEFKAKNSQDELAAEIAALKAN